MPSISEVKFNADIRKELTSLLTPADLKRFLAEVAPLIRPSSKGVGLTPAKSREIIEKLVLTQNKTSFSLVDKLLFLMACNLSGKHLPGYSTLDEMHIKSITDLLVAITSYANDTSQKRPLVFLMLASPGAGKSHFIKCIANELESSNVSAITYNMAGLQSSDDMIPPLDATRNLKVEDRIPLLFLDEFDSSPAFIPMLLPLLWDGEVTIGQRDLKLGKVIIVLAGSDPALPTTMEDARSMRAENRPAQGQPPKIIDLLSRINGGVFSIPTFYDAGKQIDRRADKVCIAVELLRQRFGNQLQEAPLSFLRFVALADFRYGVRSIAHLVSVIPFKVDMTSLHTRGLGLPFDNVAKLKNSSLAYHLLHPDQSLGVEKLWRECNHNDCMVPIRHSDIRLLRMDYMDDRYFVHNIVRVLNRLHEKPSRMKRSTIKKRKKPSRP